MFERSTSFWNARDTGTAKTIANQANRVASQKQKYGAPKLENTARLWTLKGEQYLGNRTSIIKYAGAQVEIDPAIRADTLKLLEKIAPDLAEAFDRVLPPLMFNAWRNWPVSSGYSKSALILSYAQTRESFVGKIGNAAPYVFFIRNSPHINLLQRPAVTAAAEIGGQVFR